MTIAKHPFELFDRNYTRTPDGCWEWKASRHRQGYGNFSSKHSGRKWSALAHRVSWEIHNGSIPEGMDVCHHCDNPPCVNPAHLFLGTHTDNMKDAAKKKRFLRNGINNGRARLNEESAYAILWMVNSGLRRKQLANDYQVSLPMVDKIAHRDNWLFEAHD